MQYFRDRSQAGIELAKRLEHYRDRFGAIISLSQGGVLVAKEIAENLRLPIGMLAVREIRLPWENAPVIGSVDMSGEFTVNPQLDINTVNDYEAEYRNQIDQERIKISHEINLMHAAHVMSRNNLRDRIIIIVSDGLASELPIFEALNYLKPVRTPRTVVALPVATIDVVDFLHINVDEIHCLDVKTDYVSTDHYYEDNQIPSYEEILDILIQYDTLE